MLDVDVNDGVYVNNERQQSEHNSGISFPVIRKEHWERFESNAARSRTTAKNSTRCRENQNTHEQIKVNVPPKSLRA